jgi:hypothetical protein
MAAVVGAEAGAPPAGDAGAGPSNQENQDPVSLREMFLEGASEIGVHRCEFELAGARALSRPLGGADGSCAPIRAPIDDL